MIFGKPQPNHELNKIIAFIRHQLPTVQATHKILAIIKAVFEFLSKTPMAGLSIHTFLPRVNKYLKTIRPTGIPGWSSHAQFHVHPLAQGEYSMNFLISQQESAWLLRVNTGSEIGLTDQEQIAYEYQTLQLLEPAGVGPVPYFLDDSFQHLPFGIMGMSYLPGKPLDYHRDLFEAARLFARYHQLEIPPDRNHLIREEKPLSQTFEHCIPMLEVYMGSDQADPQLCTYFREIISWANEARLREKYLADDPWRCLINTEVNNSNWIVNRKAGTIHLVDWEKAQWGDPSQDLSHFRVPTTTLWKTDVRLTVEAQQRMMASYKASLYDPHLRDTIEDRTALRDPFNCLRGISWCAMAWIQYQSGKHLLKNPDTFEKLSLYVDLIFVRELFDPYLQASQI